MKKGLLFYRILLIMLAFLGVYLEVAKYGGHMFMYYTVLSNALVLGFMLYLVYLMLTQPESVWASNKVLRLKAGVTMAIMITLVIYHILLAPIADNFWRLENILCHYLVPALMFLDTLVVDRQRQYRAYDPILWAVTPLVYCIFALFNGLVTKIPIPDAKDSPFPYFFVNVTKYGWPYVGRMIAIICLVYILSGYLLYGIKQIKRK
ncbi:hypothetical protein ABID29_001890 [Streptococcus rupicaprae]|uniref:Pr6Pr family membrane protein n=1 Tax=Streptococcus rupicaprae TaxID=759619 RepID=A0ABV2FJQ8_9STRE